MNLLRKKQQPEPEKSYKQEYEDALRDLYDYVSEMFGIIDELSENIPSFGTPRQLLNKLWLETAIMQAKDEDEVVELKKEYDERNHRARSSAFESGQIAYAFTSGGIDYYKFADFNNMPPLRSLKTMVYYEEMRMKTSLEYLELHTKAEDEIIKKMQEKFKVSVDEVKKLDEKVKQGLYVSLDNDFLTTIINGLADIKKLNEQMKQRIFIAIDLDLLYKVASIVYFDKDEDYTDYSFDYNRKKMLHWKQHDGPEFFFRPPLLELMPILKDMKENLVTYSQVVDQMNAKHLENILSNLPQSVREKLKSKSSSLQAVMQPD